MQNFCYEQGQGLTAWAAMPPPPPQTSVWQPRPIFDDEQPNIWSKTVANIAKKVADPYAGQVFVITSDKKDQRIFSTPVLGLKFMTF